MSFSLAVNLPPPQKKTPFITSHNFACQFEISARIRLQKEQYRVTAHAPNFDFWTGRREIKR